MSLLMDALRKAEEEKKRAEQGNKSESESETQSANAETGDAAPAEKSPTESTTLRPETPTDEKIESEAQGIPDPEIEFEQIEEPDLSSSALASSLELELEPKSGPDVSRTPVLNESEETEVADDETINFDSSENTGLGNDLESEPALTPSEAESSLSEIDNSESEDFSIPEEDDVEKLVTKPELTELETQQEFTPVVLEESQDDSDETEEDFADQAESADSEESPPIDSEEDKTAALFAIPQPKVKTPNSAVDADQDERISARSVFAAKRAKQKQKRNLQIAGIGMVAVMVIGTGLVYFYLSSSSNSGITIPEGFVVEQQTFGNEEANFSEDVPAQGEAIFDSANEITLTESEIAIESVVVEAEEVATVLEGPAETDIALSEISTQNSSPETAQTISQVIGEPVVSAQPATEQVVTSALLESDEFAVLIESEIAESIEIQNATPSVSAENSAISEATEGPGAVLEEPVSLISFTRKEAQSLIDPMLANAYIAYQQGDLTTAKNLYQQALITAPLGRDALIGLAAIAVSEDDPFRAMEFYSQLLARDPGDPVARAGILDLQPAGSPTQIERELRRLNSLHPNLAPLIYALGNYYASQDQWSDAQQQYFRALQVAKSDALQGQPVNPDFAFNLAVSLEHLSQPVSALNYYEEAIEFAGNHPAGFNLSVAQSRLENLGQTEAE